MSNRLQRLARERLSREEGSVRKDWGGKIPIALVYPNLYPVGMANLGFLTVYGLLNRHDDVVCERAFLPETDAREEMVRTGVRVFSLETQRPLDDFEILAFSLSYENDYANLAAILALARIPAERSRRGPEHPLLLAGGPAAFLNPEPLAEIVDVFLLGEAEEVLEEFLDRYRENRGPAGRTDLVRSLPSLEGVYVPSRYRPRYGEDGTLSALEPMEGAPARVRRRWVKDLDAFPTATTVVTPEAELPGIFLVELGRGCGRRCRFCSTGCIYGPVRYRRPEVLREALGAGIERGLRLGLVCASFGDYPDLDALCDWILDAGGRLSAPSLRVERLTDRLLEALRASGQRSVTLAPEAGNDRLRRLLNKPFTDEDLLDTADRLAGHGIFGMRLYFMVGLPGEQDRDVMGVADLTRRIRHRFLRAARSTARMGEITLSIHPFVPKPSSVFQWCAMEEERTLKARLKRIRDALRKVPNVTVTHGLPKWAYLQALFSRGDRRVLPFVLAGASAEPDWKRLFRTSSLNPDFFVYRRRPEEEVLPWDFIDHGVSREGLYREYAKRLLGMGGDR